MISMEDLIEKVIEDWKWQVRDMSDYDLNEDRSEWMKNYGRKHKSDLVDEFENDIHAILDQEYLTLSR